MSGVHAPRIDGPGPCVSPRYARVRYTHFLFQSFTVSVDRVCDRHTEHTAPLAPRRELHFAIAYRTKHFPCSHDAAHSRSTASHDPVWLRTLCPIFLFHSHPPIVLLKMYYGCVMCSSHRQSPSACARHLSHAKKPAVAGTDSPACASFQRVQLRS